MKVVVTGGAGYIGGQTVLNLLDAGHNVFAIDRSLDHNHLHDCGAKWLTADFAGEVSLHAIKSFHPDAIIHCAGTSLVGPSLANPEEYYHNNFVKTKILCDFLIQQKLGCRLIFSSSAATYGNPIITPISEVDPTEPISPYGQSKLMIDWMLQSYNRAYSLDYVSFRYFNACGADPRTRHGQAPGATHIIARVLESMRDDREFTLYGTKYPTEDGTCVRDYIHVDDLAHAHITAMESSIPSGIYNLGTDTGTSNAQIIDAARAITGKSITVSIADPREGDPAMLTADASKFLSVSGWKPQWKLEDILKHAWAWYNV